MEVETQNQNGVTKPVTTNFALKVVLFYNIALDY
jgi:hypothetical protein